MSILSDLINKRITWKQAAGEIESWFAHLGGSPIAQAAESAAKQVASDAAGMGETALGPIIDAGVITVEGAAKTALTAAVGPVAAGALTPVIDAGITKVADALKGQIDAEAAKLRAKLAGPSPQPA